jgi:hypothetical protein
MRTQGRKVRDHRPPVIDQRHRPARRIEPQQPRLAPLRKERQHAFERLPCAQGGIGAGCEAAGERLEFGS